jgi:asparagine synthase (glutamine-hydrolysing)
MCGITGFFDPSFTINPEAYQPIITHMSATLYHRGPDDSGAWMDVTKGIVLGFRRLAIIDLPTTGHQPMVSGNGRYVMVFNGEVYNFGDIRQELLALGHTFRGTSDTEVMLAAISQWGVELSLIRFNGMFAFVLWDRQNCALTLARGRIGIKPLYYGWAKHVFLFGSELKSFKANPAFHTDIDREALFLFIRHSYVPPPFLIFKNIHKLQPGTYITISGENIDRNPLPQPYWSLFNVVQDGLDHPYKGDDQEAVDEFETILSDSIRRRMIADVPLGAFLSGGVDSSTIVALMQAQSPLPVKTFTIGYAEKRFNEANYAREVAEYLKTDHTELYVSPDDAVSVIPKLPVLYDEPFSDSSQIPTFLVSQLARPKVTVNLSGDGGDELFYGYDRYFQTDRISKFTSLFNGSLADVGIQFLRAATSDQLKWLWKGLGGYSTGTKMHQTIDRMVKLAGMFKLRSPEEIHFRFVTHLIDPRGTVLGGNEPATILLDKSKWPSLRNFNETMMYLDQMTYLPGDILAKVDRASMGGQPRGKGASAG